MAKEFKAYDKKYAALKGTGLNSLGMNCNSLGFILWTALAKKSGWRFKGLFSENYSPSDIRNAVYVAADHEEWQKFRVSLKRLTIYEKLFCLEWYWREYVESGFNPGHQSRTHIIRVNNYLGALKRGGYLDAELNIIKQ